MTLIAAWKENNTPILIGDLVVSSQNLPGVQHGKLPTRENLNHLFPESWEKRIVRTSLKIYKISDSFVIGWTGYLRTARTIIEDIITTYGGTDPTLDDISRYFTHKSECYEFPCSIIGWCIEDKTPYCFRWSSDNWESFEISKWFVEGSGKKSFLDIFQPDVFVGSDDPVNSVVSKIAHLLGQEVLYGTNLWNLFGGGFQVLYLNNKGFQFVPSITFIFLHAKEYENRIDFVLNKRILKFEYDNSHFRALTLLAPENGKLGEKEIYYTSPIYMDSINLDLSGSEFTLQADYYCFFILFLLKQNIPAVWTYCLQDHEKEPIIYIQKGTGTEQSLIIGEEFFKITADFLKNLDRTRI